MLKIVSHSRYYEKSVSSMSEAQSILRNFKHDWKKAHSDWEYSESVYPKGHKYEGMICGIQFIGMNNNYMNFFIENN